MSELGHNYNIQCRRLFQELKATFPCTPDAAVRQCMKQNRNDIVKCKLQLEQESKSYAVGRYGLRNQALLSHQMDQFLKLNNELSEGKKEVEGLKGDIKGLEQELKNQEMMLDCHPPKLAPGDVKMLEGDISNLRGDCDDMSKKVTNLTAGKVPLGETSINFENYLNPRGQSVPESPVATRVPTNIRCGEEDKWSCSECTFQNHPSMQSCEICEMPRITLGTNQSSCFCHSKTFHQLDCASKKKYLEDKPPKIFSPPKYDNEERVSTNIKPSGGDEPNKL